MTSSEPIDPPATAIEAMLDLRHPRKMAAKAWIEARTPSDGEGRVDSTFWRDAADFGVQGLMMPPSLGGSGTSAVEALLTLEGLGLGTRDNGMAFALSAQVIAMQQALLQFGSPAQLDRWLVPLIAGKCFGAFAMSEADAGSDTASISTTATEQADGSFILNGAKAWATLGPVCDVAIIFATTDPAKGVWGHTAFLVDASTPGFHRDEERGRMGMRSCPIGSIVLEDCHVGPESILGRPGTGHVIFGKTVDAERALLYGTLLGAMERVIDTATQRAQARRQGGTNIGNHQAVSHRIVEMKLRHEAARLLLYKAAAIYDRNDSISLAASLAKLQTAEMGVESALDLMRVFGAAGFLDEVGVEAELRDAVAGLSFSGTPDVTRNIVASHMKLDRPKRL